VLNHISFAIRRRETLVVIRPKNDVGEMKKMLEDIGKGNGTGEGQTQRDPATKKQDETEKWVVDAGHRKIFLDSDAGV
jgi:hypothetical protein